MTRLAKHRHAAVRAHDIERVPGEARVVDDARTGLALEERLREQTDEVVALDETTCVIEKETAVEVAVPSEAHIGAVLTDRLDGGRAVGLEHRVRHAVREVAIGCVTHLDELERQMRREQIDERPRPTVAGVDDDLQATKLAAVDVREQMLDVPHTRIERVAHARAPARRSDRRRQPPLADHRRHLLEARVGADRARPLAHELHAIVIGRVVARRDHDAAVERAARAVTRRGRVVHALGAAEPDVVDIDAALEQALRERRRERWASQAHVVPDHDALGLHKACVGTADRTREVFVDLVGDAAADVVGLESGEIHVICFCYPARTGPRSGRCRPRRGSCPIAPR